MVSRIVNQPVLVVRDGKQVAPDIGKAFDFTPEEVAEIEKLNAPAISVPPVAVEAVAAKK